MILRSSFSTEKLMDVDVHWFGDGPGEWVFDVTWVVASYESTWMVGYPPYPSLLSGRVFDACQVFRDGCLRVGAAKGIGVWAAGVDVGAETAIFAEADLAGLWRKVVESMGIYPFFKEFVNQSYIPEPNE